MPERGESEARTLRRLRRRFSVQPFDITDDKVFCKLPPYEHIHAKYDQDPSLQVIERRRHARVCRARTSPLKRDNRRHRHRHTHRARRVVAPQPLYKCLAGHAHPFSGVHRIKLIERILKSRGDLGAGLSSRARARRLLVVVVQSRDPDATHCHLSHPGQARGSTRSRSCG